MQSKRQAGTVMFKAIMQPTSFFSDPVGTGPAESVTVTGHAVDSEGTHDGGRGTGDGTQNDKKYYEVAVSASEQGGMLKQKIKLYVVNMLQYDTI